jgi:hypothetical protein
VLTIAQSAGAFSELSGTDFCEKLLIAVARSTRLCAACDFPVLMADSHAVNVSTLLVHLCHFRQFVRRQAGTATTVSFRIGDDICPRSGGQLRDGK